MAMISGEWRVASDGIKVKMPVIKSSNKNAGACCKKQNE